MSSVHRALVVRSTWSSGMGSVRTGACWLVIALSAASLLWNGVIAGLLRQEIHRDFTVFYAAGQLWNEGLDPYDPGVFQGRFEQVVEARQTIEAAPGTPPKPAVYAYPPPATVLLALLARLPIERAFAVMTAFNLGLLVICLFMLGLVLARFRPIGLAEVALLAALGNTGFARANLTTGETSIVAAVLLFGCVILASSRHRIWAGLVLGCLSVKPTSLPLIVGYFGLKRRFLLVLTCAAIVLATLLVPLLATHRSVVTTAANYAQMLQRYQQDPGQDTSPFVASSVALLNLHPLINRILNADSPATAVLSWMIILVLCACTALLCLRSPSTPRNDLLDFSLVSVTSLLALSYHHYDQFLLFPAIVYVYVEARSRTGEKSSGRWLVFVAVIVLLIALPNDASTRISERLPGLLDSYLWRVIAPFQSWAVVTVMGVLLWLKVGQVRSMSPRGLAP